MEKFTFLIVGVILIMLKILNIVEWPWSIVLIPIWVHLAIAIIVAAVVVVQIFAPFILNRKGKD